MKRNILIWKNKCWESKGSNLGDIAIIEAMIRDIKEKVKDANILIFSDDPAYTSQKYNIEAVKLNLPNIFSVIRRVDLLIIGGGTVFTDNSSISIIPINISLPILAYLYKKPVVFYGCATGEMTKFGEALVKLILKNVNFACVRDEQTKEKLIRLNKRMEGITHVSGDTAFALVSDEFHGIEKENVLIISPRRIFHYSHSILPFYLRKKLRLLPKNYQEKMDDFLQQLADTADYFVTNYKYKIKLLPMYSAIGDADGISNHFKKKYSSRDDLICEEVISRMANKKDADIIYSDNPIDVMSEIAKAKLLIGVPLHSLIFSHIVLTPFVGISYQGKINRFMINSGLEENVISAESIHCDVKAGQIIEKIERVINNYETYLQKMRKTNADYFEKSKLPSQMISDFFERGK